MRGTESIDIRTSDGWSLRADVHEPGGTPIGVAVLATSIAGWIGEIRHERKHAS